MRPQNEGGSREPAAVKVHHDARCPVRRYVLFMGFQDDLDAELTRRGQAASAEHWSQLMLEQRLTEFKSAFREAEAWLVAHGHPRLPLHRAGTERFRAREGIEIGQLSLIDGDLWDTRLTKTRSTWVGRPVTRIDVFHRTLPGTFRIETIDSENTKRGDLLISQAGDDHPHQATRWLAAHTASAAERFEYVRQIKI